MSSRQSEFALPGALAIVEICMGPVQQAEGTIGTHSSGSRAAAVSPVWIKYSVTGDAELQARE